MLKTVFVVMTPETAGEPVVRQCPACAAEAATRRRLKSFADEFLRRNLPKDAAICDCPLCEARAAKPDTDANAPFRTWGEAMAALNGLGLAGMHRHQCQQMAVAAVQGLRKSVEFAEVVSKAFPGSAERWLSQAGVLWSDRREGKVLVWRAGPRLPGTPEPVAARDGEKKEAAPAAPAAPSPSAAAPKTRACRNVAEAIKAGIMPGISLWASRGSALVIALYAGGIAVAPGGFVCWSDLWNYTHADGRPLGVPDDEAAAVPS